MFKSNNLKYYLITNMKCSDNLPRLTLKKKDNLSLFKISFIYFQINYISKQSI